MTLLSVDTPDGALRTGPCRHPGRVISPCAGEVAAAAGGDHQVDVAPPGADRARTPDRVAEALRGAVHGAPRRARAVRPRRGARLAGVRGADPVHGRRGGAPPLRRAVELRRLDHPPLRADRRHRRGRRAGVQPARRGAEHAHHLRRAAAHRVRAELLPSAATDLRAGVATAAAGHALDPSHLLWLAVAAAYATIASALNTAAGGHPRDAGRLVVGFGLSFFLWLWTPSLLLGRRVERRSLRITSALTATAMTAFGVASVFYMPQSIASASQSFGSIGIAIAIVSWLIGVGFILVASAGLGAVLAERSPWIRPRALGRRHRGALEREPDQAEREL